MIYEAEQRGKEIVAKNFLLLGIPIPTIIAGTGLTEEQIKKIQKEVEGC